MPHRDAHRAFRQTATCLGVLVLVGGQVRLGMRGQSSAARRHFDDQALALPTSSARFGHSRIVVARGSTSGTVRVDPPQAEPANAAELLEALGDIAGLPLSHRERRLVKQLRSGVPFRPHGRTARTTHEILVRTLERERDRRIALVAPGPLEAKPLTVLGLSRWVESRLSMAGIDTVGQLLERSGVDLLRLPNFGAYKVRHVRLILWARVQRVLKDGTAPFAVEPEGSPVRSRIQKATRRAA